MMKGRTVLRQTTRVQNVIYLQYLDMNVYRMRYIHLPPRGRDFARSMARLVGCKRARAQWMRGPKGAVLPCTNLGSAACLDPRPQ